MSMIVEARRRERYSKGEGMVSSDGVLIVAGHIDINVALSKSGVSSTVDLSR
jgi:hypothetical protein